MILIVFVFVLSLRSEDWASIANPGLFSEHIESFRGEMNY